MQVVEVIPYKSFKEKLQLMKILEKTQKCKLEVFSNYIYVEISNFSRG